MTKYIVICGNPADGYDHTGPFDTHEDAEAYMGKGFEDDDASWVVHLLEPVPSRASRE